MVRQKSTTFRDLATLAFRGGTRPARRCEPSLRRPNIRPYRSVARFVSQRGPVAKACRRKWSAYHGSYRRCTLGEAAGIAGFSWTGPAHKARQDAQALRSLWSWLQN